ncbi:MAG: hypothetical protein E4H13_05205 [Calditrichales bacterium]|nr:MAG: hypothetical protein E4H13_05205 [Calditrichales bacterium]
MNSEKKILERYEKENNRYIIQISSNTFRDLFNKYDRVSSFIKRDLNSDFAEYLYESATDLYGRDFYVCLNLHTEEQSDELEDKVNKGIDNYFEYERNIVDTKRKQVVKKIIIHVLLAIVCFFISFTFNKIIIIDSFLHMLFVESLVIAAWVLMWPVFSDFFYELFKIRQTKNIYNKIIDAELKFNYINVSKKMNTHLTND